MRWGRLGGSAAAINRVWAGQAGGHVAHGEIALRVAPIRPEGEQRLEDEETLVERRMRHREGGGGDDRLAEGEEVAIEDTCCPAAAAAAAELGLGALEESEELPGGALPFSEQGAVGVATDRGAERRSLDYGGDAADLEAALLQRLDRCR